MYLCGVYFETGVPLHSFKWVDSHKRLCIFEQSITLELNSQINFNEWHTHQSSILSHRLDYKYMFREKFTSPWAQICLDFFCQSALINSLLQNWTKFTCTPVLGLNIIDRDVWKIGRMLTLTSWAVEHCRGHLITWIIAKFCFEWKPLQDPAF